MWINFGALQGSTSLLTFGAAVVFDSKLGNRSGVSIAYAWWHTSSCYGQALVIAVGVWYGSVGLMLLQQASRPIAKDAAWPAATRTGAAALLLFSLP
jgi:hypothetical protein